MGLKDINIKGSYTGKGQNILNEFLLPSLSNAVKYDRITGYFTIDSLISIANGIDSIRRKSGKMRLIVGVHSIPEELIDATLAKNHIKNEILKIQQDISNDIQRLSDMIEKKKIVTLAWMIDCGLLSVKAAAVKGDGIFHPKTMIIKDQDNNEIAAVGSSNETRNGLGGNFEQLMVATSWSNLDAVNDQKQFFSALWNNEDDEAIVLDISEETAEMIKNTLGKEYDYIVRMLTNVVEDVFGKMIDMPVNFFVSGNIPSLYMHQERAVIDALSRWPVRVLFSDEVGLGKTFEAAATLTYLNKYCNLKRIVILTPKSVLKQWQDELKMHFGLNVWLFDSSKKEYISADNEIIRMSNRNPLGDGSPNIILMSAQYARGNKNSNGLLSEKDTILPDLLVVDEAHSARVSEDLSGKNTKTQMYKMLENVSKRIPHIILATATPMQKNACEYHAMLKLLGLPKIWEKEENFLSSLDYIMSDSIKDLSDANKIVSLLYYTISKMKPDLSVLSAQEKSLVDQIILLFNGKNNIAKVTFVQKEWKHLKTVFIKLHPARLLTVRNTRRSLAELGYKFPKRNLHEKTLYDSDNVKLFYRRVNKYLNDECFSIEKELNPEKKLNVGFIRISYQQRVASSLYSCKMSLERRMKKVEDLQKTLQRGIITKGFNTIDSDDIDNDELLNMDIDDIGLSDNSNINLSNLQRATNKEYFSLKSLVDDVNSLLNSEGDKKIDESIDLALNVLDKGDSVLLFSRYTDTVDSLIKVFNSRNVLLHYNYAIYTGDRSLIVKDGLIEECDKNQIKKMLFSKEVRIVFCSDAASEGLNLQAARVLINVDVPWTPARLEQRIGRVARLGQVADEVDIYNVWYPNSVEAKMYHRIQDRLKNTNIAIGEFPEVIADNIKNAILYGTDDTSLEMLKSIRNNMQKEALHGLWLNEKTSLTYSDAIRKKLIDICKDELILLRKDSRSNIHVFSVFDKGDIELTSNPGQRESISLNTLKWLKINKTVYGLKIDKNGVCITDSNNNAVKTESILDAILSKGQEYEFYHEYPSVLPKSNRLSLAYAVENYNTPSPNFWIEKEGED